MKWREAGGVRWLEAELPGARAAFSTRVGGASSGPFTSLNLGLYTDDEEARVRENRARLSAALEREPDGVLFGFQVHASDVLRRERAPDPNPFVASGAPPGKADGQATANPALTPLVQVADCLPVALAGERGVAMLHCGWRGLAAGIVERGVREVGAVAAAIGPGIGPCCYEVGEEVLSAFADLGEGVASGRMLDLPEIACRRLARAGVEEIEASGLCTSCEPELFFSHRRDAGRTGRQAGLVWVDGADG
jgi:YfiH family protein